MPCCKAEKYGWCGNLDTHKIEGKEYCVFHASEKHKSQTPDNFNKLIFKRIQEAIDEKRECDLSGTIFPYPIKFYIFKDNVLPQIFFRNATFTEDAVFIDVIFSEFADFNEATFRKDTLFSNATFSKSPNFYKATFSGRAAFENATFGEGANFYKATFSKRANFNKSAFGKETLFFNATLSSCNFEKTGNDTTEIAERNTIL